MKISAVCLAAVAQAIPDPYWPGQNATAGVNCGFVETLPIGSNQTCTIEIVKGGAALVNAGGVFITMASDSNNVFHVHSYDGHGEANTGSVRFQVFSRMSPVWYNPGARWSKYPEKWDTEECYSDDDANAGMDAAVIRGGKCVDNETQVEGIYMMGFGTDIVGNGIQNVQVMNTAGHRQGNMYEFQFNDMKGDPVAVEPVQGSFNGTLIGGPTTGSLMAILDEDYYGQLLQVQFKYPEADIAKNQLAPGPDFKIATAFRSTVKDSTPP